MISPEEAVHAFVYKISSYQLARRLPVGALHNVLYFYIAVFFHQSFQLTFRTPLGRGLGSISVTLFLSGSHVCDVMGIAQALSLNGSR